MTLTAFLGGKIGALATTIDSHRRGIDEVGETLHLLVNLLGQLASGGHDDAVDGVGGVAIAVQVRKNGQQVGSCLAGARLCYGNHIIAIEHRGDGHLLHRSTLAVFHIFQGIHHALI